jgi:transposase
MAPYSMDLRERVARAWDVSGDAEDVAATFGVSRAWVHRLIQRRRETDGELVPQGKNLDFKLRRARTVKRMAARIAIRTVPFYG